MTSRACTGGVARSRTCHLRVASGEIVGLVGPNGAGKSTLIGVLATLVRPTGGDVRYGGRQAREIGDALRGRIGVLGHDLFLYADLTARENLMFFGRLHGVPIRRVAASTKPSPPRDLTDRANDRVSRILARPAPAAGARACAHPLAAAGPARRAVYRARRRVVGAARDATPIARRQGRNRRDGDARLRKRGRRHRSAILSQPGPRDGHCRNGRHASRAVPRARSLRSASA